MQTSQRGDLPIHGRRSQPSLTETPYVLLDQALIRFCAIEELEILIEIAPVSIERVSGQSVLNAEGNQVLLDTVSKRDRV
jgi:hypothetical protein